MNRKILNVILVALIFGLTAIKVTTASESKQDVVTNKSVAWYVANIKAAKMQNQECHDNPGLQSSPNCANALHALEIAFKGGN